MEAFIRAILPSILGETTSFEVYPYQGKRDLLSHLEQRLRGYAAWIPDTWRIIVIVDRDDDDCLNLKSSLENMAKLTTLRTRKSSQMNWNLVFAIAIEELEAWYFGDWNAVCRAYPRLDWAVVRSSRYRHCDEISGGTWEAFERVLQKAGYFSGGLRKIEAARMIGRYFDSGSCSSPSYKYFENALLEATEHSG